MAGGDCTRYAQEACLQYLHEEAHCPWDISTTNAAAMRIIKDGLVYMLAQGCPRDETTCAAVASRMAWHFSSYVARDHLKILRDAGCPWDVTTTRAAAQNDNLQLRGM